MRLLDLFCGDGLAARGYAATHLFDEIVGVDIVPHKAYPYKFLCADALSLDYEFLSGFDFIHASPPCQAYSVITPTYARGRHERLIPNVLRLLAAAKPKFWVVENVPGAKRELRPNLMLEGGAFGLASSRPRMFRTSTDINECLALMPQRERVAGVGSVAIHGRDYIKKERLVAAMDRDGVFNLGDCTRVGIEQGIPPVMTYWIAHALVYSCP